MAEKAILPNFDFSHIPPSASVLVAFSGGVDSTVCLDVLHSTRPDLTIAAYYLDHGIRQDTQSDIDHIIRFCAKRDIHVTIDKADIPAIARLRKQSLEETGRAVRYERLTALAKAKQHSYVVTAHHAGDQVESILMQLLTGTSGLRVGIHEKTALTPEVMLVRPMLHVDKVDIFAYAEDNKLEYVDDSTNACLDFTRNKLRSVVLPMIQNLINPSVDKALLRFKQLSDDMTGFLDTQLDSVWAEIMMAEKIKIRRLLKEPRFIQTEIVKRWVREHCPEYRLTYDRIQELLDFIIADRPPADYDLAGQWVMKRAKRQAWIEEKH